MKLSSLPKTTQRAKKRIGRGRGTGKGGHTVGRGKYGQKSREKVGLLFEGTKLKKSLLKRLPLLRGKGKFKPADKPLIVNLKYLNLFKDGETVNLEGLAVKGIIKKEEGLKYGVKILGEGNLERSLNVYLPVSQPAKEKIEKAKGKVVGSIKSPKEKDEKN